MSRDVSVRVAPRAPYSRKDLIISRSGFSRWPYDLEMPRMAFPKSSAAVSFCNREAVSMDG
jgi:hypothetical protein